MNLVPNVLISEAHAPIANANNTDANSDILDMSGYDGVVFIVPIEDSANTAVATLTVEASTTNSDTAMAAITGAVATATDAGGDALNGKLLIVDVHKPLKRYVQAVLTSTVGLIAFGTCIAIRYNGRKAPVTADATVLQATTVVGS
jgi:hypothetical protein